MAKSPPSAAIHNVVSKPIHTVSGPAINARPETVNASLRETSRWHAPTFLWGLIPDVSLKPELEI